jgi:hypothetical protein
MDARFPRGASDVKAWHGALASAHRLPIALPILIQNWKRNAVVDSRRGRAFVATQRRALEHKGRYVARSRHLLGCAHRFARGVEIKRPAPETKSRGSKERFGLLRHVGNA